MTFSGLKVSKNWVPRGTLARQQALVAQPLMSLKSRDGVEKLGVGVGSAAVKVGGSYFL